MAEEFVDSEKEMDALLVEAIRHARLAFKQNEPNPAKAELAGRIIQACYGSQLNLELPGVSALLTGVNAALDALPGMMAAAMGRMPGSGLSDSEPIVGGEFDTNADPTAFNITRFMNLLITRIAHDAEAGLSVDGAINFMRESIEIHPPMRDIYRIMVVLNDGETVEQCAERAATELSGFLGRDLNTPEMRKYHLALREAILTIVSDGDDAGTTTAPGDASSAAAAE